MEPTSETDRIDELVKRIWADIPLGAWLKISGPTFAVMALGFGCMWSAHQATTDRIIALQESTTQKILDAQDSMLERILEVERETTDRILELQQKMLEQHREGT